MEPLVIVILLIWTVILIRYTIRTNKHTSENKTTLRKIVDQQKELEVSTERSIREIEERRIASENSLSNQKLELNNLHELKRKEFERLIEETRELKSEFEKGFLLGRSWLSEAYSEYIKMKDSELESYFIIKPNPAWKSAELVSAIKQSKAEMAKRLKFLEYQLKSYEEYFPELNDYKLAILDELIDFRSERLEENDEIEPALKYGYISKEEYKTLSNSQKFQIALDRYWEKDKSNLEIGRLYERYVGYLYEKNGWKVRYEGIIKGYEDFGRDLICTKDKQTIIIQCKCWSKEKVIREKHIMQLFGTTVLFEHENNMTDVTPFFYSTTALSKEAEFVAKKLNVKICYQKLQRYPMIKCNVNYNTKEKIYHLPFDLQYDKIIIGDQKGEFYAEKIEEAEKRGFRRAYIWQGIN